MKVPCIGGYTCVGSHPQLPQHLLNTDIAIYGNSDYPLTLKYTQSSESRKNCEALIDAQKAVIRLLIEQGVNIFSPENHSFIDLYFSFWNMGPQLEIIDYVEIKKTALKVHLLNRFGYRTRTIKLGITDEISRLKEFGFKYFNLSSPTESLPINQLNASGLCWKCCPIGALMVPITLPIDFFSLVCGCFVDGNCCNGYGNGYTSYASSSNGYSYYYSLSDTCGNTDMIADICCGHPNENE